MGPNVTGILHILLYSLYLLYILTVKCLAPYFPMSQCLISTSKTAGEASMDGSQFER